MTSSSPRSRNRSRSPAQPRSAGNPPGTRVRHQPATCGMCPHGARAELPPTSADKGICAHARKPWPVRASQDWLPVTRFHMTCAHGTGVSIRILLSAHACVHTESCFFFVLEAWRQEPQPYGLPCGGTNASRTCCGWKPLDGAWENFLPFPFFGFCIRTRQAFLSPELSEGASWGTVKNGKSLSSLGVADRQFPVLLPDLLPMDSEEQSRPRRTPLQPVVQLKARKRPEKVSE